MTVYIDADACPVTRIAEQIAHSHSIACVLLCDTNHVLFSDISEVITIGAGRDAVDIALINRCKKGDVVITQDYGVAAMALGKGCHCMHQSGMRFTEHNIDRLLFERAASAKARRSSAKNHLKGPRKRTKEDDEHFAAAFEKLLNELTGCQT
ncbi:MAG: YaiI/YqxD family protein [Clostridia bacterium]|nr:YaiI/YqxD family protein [Clostridia bacterium]MBR2415049.1 YaiI/YqxD family protein [Clostridia bacterium]